MHKKLSELSPPMRIVHGMSDPGTGIRAGLYSNTFQCRLVVTNIQAGLITHVPCISCVQNRAR